MPQTPQDASPGPIDQVREACGHQMCLSQLQPMLALLATAWSSLTGLRHEEPLRQHRPGEQPPGNPGAAIAAIAELLGTLGTGGRPHFRSFAINTDRYRWIPIIGMLSSWSSRSFLQWLNSGWVAIVECVGFGICHLFAKFIQIHPNSRNHVLNTRNHLLNK